MRTPPAITAKDRKAHPGKTTFNVVIRSDAGSYVSLQIAILKVLVSHPEGRATISALADLAVFSSVRMSVAMGWSDALPAAYAASAK